MLRYIIHGKESFQFMIVMIIDRYTLTLTQYHGGDMFLPCGVPSSDVIIVDPWILIDIVLWVTWEDGGIVPSRHVQLHTFLHRWESFGSLYVLLVVSIHGYMFIFSNRILK